jgi:hypothetical protein
MFASTYRSAVINRRQLVGYVAGILGFLVPAIFAWDIYIGHIKDPNTATWLMIWALDFVGLWIVVAEKNPSPWLQVGWFAASILILTAIFVRGGSWNWGVVETACIALCGAAVVLWQICKMWKATEKYGVWVGLSFQTLATYVAFAPQAVNYWEHPQPNTWYLWFFSTVTGFMAVYAADDRHNPANVFIPYACSFLNTLILILVLL